MEYRETRYGVCSPGFRAWGIRRGKYGVAIIAADRPCEAVAVFTRNSVKAAPVKYTKKVIKGGIQAIVANSGNANCCVPQGMEDAAQMANDAARAVGIAGRHIAVSSTGIIGRRMDMETVKNLIDEVADCLAPSPNGSLQAAKAIMTTDTRIKMYSAEYKGIRVGGICKGSGMIAPNMATMLAFVTTNARLTRQRLQAALTQASEASFNMVSVDGDMSTNDTCLLMSTGAQKCDMADFLGLLTQVLKELAKMIARDGEGASKFLEFEVKGAGSLKDARTAARAITNSPLVKCAFYGENPNWGRILCAMGAKIRVDEDKVDLSFQSDKGKATLVAAGRILNPEPARAVLASRNIKVVVDLHSGAHSATAWGCDLTPEYVKINAGYN